MAIEIENALARARALVPNTLYLAGQKPYHYLLALASKLWYGNPSREIKVIAITGTKGKTTTVEILNSILEEAGFKTSLSSTLRTKIGEQEQENLYKMTTPGRFFLQRFLRRSVEADCEYAIIEMTSQAVLLYRHRFVEMDGLIFTGIHPEHIEAHGSFENYLRAKLALVDRLVRSPKRPRVVVANNDDPYGYLFLDQNIEQAVPYHLVDWPGYKTKLPGDFNKMNIIAGATMAITQGIGPEAIRKGIEKIRNVPGRMESIDAAKEKGFEVVVDYAHTGGSLEAVYKMFKDKHLICVLGSCGGGRDKWVRPVKGKLAETYCSKIILTDEDPYDEDPEAIVGDILSGFNDQKKAMVEMDRRKAIAKALSYAKEKSVVLITGKGTDPYIMGPRGRKTPWSDKRVAEEELAKLK